MLTSSYPKYVGETTAPFIEEIAAGLVRRGHTVHVIAPYHRDIRRAPVERGIYLHFFRYSPVRALNVYGYAESLQADVGLRGAVLAAAPLALGAGMLAMLRLTANHRPPTTRESGRAGERENENHPFTPSPLLPFSPSPEASVVVRPSSFDVIHGHWVLPNGSPAALVARL